MQPSATSSRARATYCCWLPPQPCTNSTPGIAVSGETSVPQMRSSPTAISNLWSRVDIGLHGGVLREQAERGIAAAIVHARGARDLRRFAVELRRFRAYRPQPRVGV